MVETFNNSEEARRDLLHEVALLRKQSLIALILAILFILITVYLYLQLKETNRNLDTRNESLKTSKLQLEERNKKIDELNKQLGAFREQYLQNAEHGSPPKKRYTISRRSQINSTARADTAQSYFGYIVYIQDRQGSQVSQNIRHALKSKGAIVPAIEHMSDRVKFSSTIKYFHKEDKVMADFMQGLILKTLSTMQIKNSTMHFPVRYIVNDKVPLGQLEVWVDS